jgi:hypothetical protein
VNGAQGRNRTTDTAIFSRMLYQLSYLGGLAPSRRRRSRLIGAGPGLVQSGLSAISLRAATSAERDVAINMPQSKLQCLRGDL